MSARKIEVKVPQQYRFVTTADAHCYQIASAYIRVEFNPETILVSKEGKRISTYDVVYHSDNVFNAIDDVVFLKGKEWYCRIIDGCEAMLGVNMTSTSQIVVATIDKKGKLVLLPENKQKPLHEFQIADEHRKTFEEYQKRLKRYGK